MRLNFLDKHNKVIIRLLERIKDSSGKFADKVIKSFGSFPKEATLEDESVKDLLHQIVKEVQEFSEFQLDSLNTNEFVDLVNRILPSNEASVYNLSTLVISKLMDSLGLNKLFRRLKKKTKREYNLYNYFTLIVASQILNPGSLLQYFEDQQTYGHFLTDKAFELQDFYDFLTFYYDNRTEIQKFFFNETMKLLGEQDVYIFYYDGTNFYFHISHADPDRPGKLEGEVIEGLRKFGKSKENRSLPLVCLGVISCSLGIPLFCTVFPGNRQEKTFVYEDLQKLEASIADYPTLVRSLFCADAGNYKGDLIYRIAGENKELADETSKEQDDYLFGRGVGTVDEETKKWILDKKGYYPLSQRKTGPRKTSNVTFVKSRIVNIKLNVKAEGGETVEIEGRQKQVALFSTKRQHKAIKTIERQLEKAQNLVENPAALENHLKKLTSEFVEPVAINEETGEVYDKVVASVDDEKLNALIERAGFFLLTTSNVLWPDGKIVRVYRDKNVAELIFKTMKNVLKTRPVYVRLREHIVAHIELCVVACVLINTLRTKIKKDQQIDVSDKKLQKILDEFTATDIGRGVYVISGKNELMSQILDTLGVKLPKVAYTKAQIRSSF